MADRIAVMREGSIVQLGSGEEIYRNPATRYVADFIGEANLLACRTSPDGTVSVALDGPALPYELQGGEFRRSVADGASGGRAGWRRCGGR